MMTIKMYAGNKRRMHASFQQIVPNTGVSTHNYTISLTQTLEPITYVCICIVTSTYICGI